jgi:hypothetical protein
MTNLEYIKSIMTDRDLANLVLLGARDSSFQWKIIFAFDKWAESFSTNKGNCVKEGIENPSIWSFELGIIPMGTEKRKVSPTT